MKENLSLEDRISMARYRSEASQARLQAARLLMEKGFFSDAISKAYYAVHSISRAILVLHDIHASTHEGVKTMLAKELIRDAKLLQLDFAKKYSQLKALREDADYEDYISYGLEDAKEAVATAEEFVQRVTDLINRIISLEQNEPSAPEGL